MKHGVPNKTDDEVNELLQHIEQNQLQTFTAQYAYKHASFKKDILEYFNPKKPGKSLAEYRNIASGCFRFEKPGRYSRGYNFYEADSLADKKLYELLSKAKLFDHAKQFQ